MDNLNDNLKSDNGKYFFNPLTCVNLILTASDIKPGTELSFSITNLISLTKNDFKKMNEKLDFYSTTLSKLDLIYFHKIRNTHNGKGLTTNTFISNDAQHLEKIMGNTTDESQGKFYGFPQECIDSFCGKNQSRVTWSDISNNIFEAIDHDIQIPTWLAYISYVPEKLDLINNDVSKSSEALGLKYQNFIREKHPDLASRLENSFFEEFSKYKTPIMDKFN